MQISFKRYAIALALICCAAQAQAGGYEDGVARMTSGDYAGAMEAWNAEAEKDPRCQYSIGYLYQFGLGVPENIGSAKQWYDKAAAANNPDALYAIGLLYETAKLGPRNLSEAMRHYRMAAAQGPNGDAEYAIGRMIMRGRGVPRDQAEGVKWLRLAAAHGHPAGQYMLGAAYEAGWGVSPSDSEALYWYLLASRNDEAELKDHDMSFQPKIAIDALKKRMSAEAVRRVEARLRQDTTTAQKPDKKR